MTKIYKIIPYYSRGRVKDNEMKACKHETPDTIKIPRRRINYQIIHTNGYKIKILPRSINVPWSILNSFTKNVELNYWTEGVSEENPLFGYEDGRLKKEPTEEERWAIGVNLCYWIKNGYCGVPYKVINDYKIYQNSLNHDVTKVDKRTTIVSYNKQYVFGEKYVHHVWRPYKHQKYAFSYRGGKMIDRDGKERTISSGQLLCRLRWFVEPKRKNTKTIRYCEKDALCYVKKFDYELPKKPLVSNYIRKKCITLAKSFIKTNQCMEELTRYFKYRNMAIKSLIGIGASLLTYIGINKYYNKRLEDVKTKWIKDIKKGVGVAVSAVTAYFISGLLIKDKTKRVYKSGSIEYRPTVRFRFKDVVICDEIDLV